MTNNNNYPIRNGQMSVSSMFYPRNNFQTKFDSGFIQNTNTLDSLANHREFNTEQNNARTFPRGLASQSMIDVNSTSSTRRAPFGKLDSMARVVSPAFQEDTLGQSKKNLDAPTFYTDSTAQSMISQMPYGLKKIQSTGPYLQANYMQPDLRNMVTKKRRQSIDLGAASKRQNNNDVTLFLRKAKDHQQGKNESKQQIDNPAAQGDFKNKNFQFLKKRREAQNQPSITGSVIGVQSMKVLPNYQNHIETTIKKPDFLSPHQNKSLHQFSPVMCPQDKQKTQNVEKNQVQVKSPNFQFKKKKLFETPIIQVASPKNSLNNGKKDFMTVRQKMAMKNMREIKLQDFQILQKLGKGAFGDVFIAQQKAIGFICVIKKMSKKRIRQAKVQEHILRQIKIQSYLNNEHITALFGYFHDQQNLYLILQALPDGSLQHVKKKKKIPQKQTAVIVKQVALGLRHMHEQYLIHRDLKPENIFMHDGIAKIGDFGCSIYNRDLALRNTVVGCLQYSSPQQLSKEGYSEKIDSWSLGILTFELLFGKSPFESDIIKIAKNKELKPQLSSLNFPQGIPIKPQTKAFIENLLNQDPQKRMDMDQVLSHEFLRQEMNKKAMKLEQFE